MSTERRPLTHLTALAITLLLAVPRPARAGSEVASAKDAGEIHGMVDYCGATGADGLEVYIPGRSFFVRLGLDGAFVMNYVPPGSYDLVISRNGQRLDALNNVVVTSGAVTDVGAVTVCNDLDGDGYDPSEDCDDSNPSVKPGAPEICRDGIDNNCNNATDEFCPECTDSDGDGFYAQFGCGTVDCVDSDPSINPAAAETCNGRDDNCNGEVDEGAPFGSVTFYRDEDFDGFGVEGDVTVACAQPEGYAAVAGDCQPQNGAVYPGAFEICDEQDNDCDGTPDDDCSEAYCDANEINVLINVCGDLPDMEKLNCANENGVSDLCKEAALQLYLCGRSFDCDQVDLLCMVNQCPEPAALVFGSDGLHECTAGDSRSCGTDEGACTSGTQTCVDGIWDRAGCEGAVGPIPEMPNGVDDDCDGDVDESDCGELHAFYEDMDHDGYGGQLLTYDPCLAGPEMVPVGDDCNDFDDNTYPGAEERCDGMDNNCNGLDVAEDEALCAAAPVFPCLEDNDGDGYGGFGVLASEAGFVDCAPMPGDCHDFDPNINPGAIEVCGDMEDNDCSGGADDLEECEPRYEVCFWDHDGDGFGGPEPRPLSREECEVTDGAALKSGDCDEGNPLVNPDMPEICGDGLDNDCMGGDEPC